MGMRELIATRAEALQGFAGQSLPRATRGLLTRAEKIVAGTVFFYGRTEVEIGLQNIDWTGAHINHQEWPAQLNRFYHLPPLAAAYRETGDERFAEAARSYIEDWIRSHPGYETAQQFMPGDSGLNMSIRLGTSHASGWGGVLPAFLASPSFDDSFPCDCCHQDVVWGWRVRLEKKELPDDTIDVCMFCLEKIATQFRKEDDEE